MHGLAVTTVEGIGSTTTKIHSVQERIAKAHGSQCGYCTPGFVMSMYTLLRNQPKPTMDDLKTAFQGNLCRCTGYRPIMEGFKTFVEHPDCEKITNGLGNTNFNGCPMGKQCCKNRNNEEKEDKTYALFQVSDCKPYDHTQEPIFPPELKISNGFDDQSLEFRGPRVTWFRPISLESLLELKQRFPESKIIVGNTEVRVEVKFKNQLYPIHISPSCIPEMTEIQLTDKGVKVGASVTLQNLESFLRIQTESQPETKLRIFEAILDMLKLFGGKQIRNMASVGGNIMTGSPTSDLNHIFMAAKVELEIRSQAGGSRTIQLDENFFTAYRENVLNGSEVLISLVIPYTEENQFFCAFKQSRRREDDRTIVNLALNTHISPITNTVQDIRICLGGMAATTTYAKTTSEFLNGKTWNEEILDLALDLLLTDLPLTPSAPGGMMLYRQSLSLSLFFKAFLKILSQLKQDNSNFHAIYETDLSAIKDFDTTVIKSSQYYRETSKISQYDTIGTPVVHFTAFQQATGEAVYCDDLPHFSNQLYMGIVWSTKAHAKIKSIDPKPALEMEGVQAFYCAKDIPKERNIFGFIVHDEEVFVSETCESPGQILGVVIADDKLLAQRAAKMVKVDYENLHPVIVSIEDAIKYESYLPDSYREMGRGNVDAAFKISKYVVEGEVRSGAQEHFYLEPAAVNVLPKNENNEIEVYCTTQDPTSVARALSTVLEIPQNRIVVKVKRVGGAFGGKETRPTALALPAAFAAQKLKRPVRCSLDRDEDILYKGTRNPFLMKYKVAFDESGFMSAIELNVYVNAGRSTDLSVMVLERALLQFFSAYNTENVKFTGICCKTNLQTCIAYRGFGSPQLTLATECAVREVADALNKDVTEIMQKNFFKEDDLTCYGSETDSCTLQKCFDECLSKSSYFDRKKEIDEYNRKNRWKKRGITVVPLLYGIGYTDAFMNCGAALVNVYTDGSVLLTHGGMEAGQGIHTKMIQIASRVLEVPISNVFISETSTDKVPNTMPTAASVTSDYNGLAVLDACEKIKNRLEPFKEKNPNGTWNDWVTAAFFDRVSLSATGYYKVPDVGYNLKENSGRAFNYFTNGVCCTEVIVDCLTGDHQILRADIVMDIGKSLNPAIDVGQIEGAFVQGVGFHTLEEMVYSPTGEVYTTGPGMYKIPGLNDIPREFNVTILKGVGNPRAVYSSKAVGEPPLCLSVSVFFAIKEAIKAARKDVGALTKFILNSPATAERIRNACKDQFTSKIKDPALNGTLPWNVVP
ncbi:xanthine dehydrogenase-like isoform X1 [Agrilus planipennis]|uniref:Xanthine dehydrogenase-like isoform X1 n=1 Tax=Agrilus planipennis TaxID=224129 RepID=A0A7F5RN37_AGRPL|nr:xanthine dehydrogenase-like isoform X1 [Agrilus planipennis]